MLEHTDQKLLQSMLILVKHHQASQNITIAETPHLSDRDATRAAQHQYLRKPKRVIDAITTASEIETGPTKNANMYHMLE